MTNSITAKPVRKGTTYSRYEIAKAKGHSLALTDLYAGFIYGEKILKARHAVAYGGDVKKSNSPSHLEPFANVDDVYLKRAPSSSLEGMAREWSKLSEHMEREQLRINPPVYDRAYVERSQFTVTDLYNDIIAEVEKAVWQFNMALLKAFGASALPFFIYGMDWDYYREERRKFRQCTHMFCLNMFAIEGGNIRNEKPRRKDSRYCCDACKKAHYDARRRFRETGSYLIREFYAPDYDESVGDRMRRYEVALSAEKIETQQAKGKTQSPVRLKRQDYQHGKVATFTSLDEAKKAGENTQKPSILAVYREIIGRPNP